MSSPFGDLAIPASGMTVSRTWLDAISDNIANINTARKTSESAFQERFVIAQAVDYGDGPGNGTKVQSVVLGNPNGRLVYAPDSPLADKDGMVRMPDINLSDQMTSMIIAQRAYQLNVAAFERSRDSYSRALEIGK